MKLKYYLRGLGIGILVTTIIMTIASPKKEASLSDEEIIARAAQLGMVMKEDADDGAAGNSLDENPENKVPEKETSVSPDQGAGDAQNPEGENPDQGAGDAQNPEGENPDQGAGDAQNPEGENPDQGAGEPEGEADNQTQGADNTPEGNDVSVPESAYRLVIERGDVCRTVCERLAANNVINDAEAMRTYLFEIGYASSMSTGEYEIPYGLTMEQVADILKSGPIKY